MCAPCGWGLPAPPLEALGRTIQPALPPPRPQPYRTLKESDSAEGDEARSPELRAREPMGPVPAPADRAASVDLLEDVFSSLDMEVPLQPLGQAKSLEDLRTPKDLREQPGTFDYQVWYGLGWDLPHMRQVPPRDSEGDQGRNSDCQRPEASAQVNLTANPARQADGQTTPSVITPDLTAACAQSVCVSGRGGLVLRAPFPGTASPTPRSALAAGEVGSAPVPAMWAPWRD